MCRGPLSRDRKSAPLWRGVLGVLLAYAIAVQGLLVAIGGFATAAPAGDQPVAFELCRHGDQIIPELPGAPADRAGCTHCVFCFAGAHAALTPAPMLFFHRVAIQMTRAAWSVDQGALPGLSAYALARPRGPPLHA